MKNKSVRKERLDLRCLIGQGHFANVLTVLDAQIGAAWLNSSTPSELYRRFMEANGHIKQYFKNDKLPDIDVMRRMEVSTRLDRTEGSPITRRNLGMVPSQYTPRKRSDNSITQYIGRMKQRGLSGEALGPKLFELNDVANKTQRRQVIDDGRSRKCLNKKFARLFGNTKKSIKVYQDEGGWLYPEEARTMGVFCQNRNKINQKTIIDKSQLVLSKQLKQQVVLVVSEHTKQPEPLEPEKSKILQPDEVKEKPNLYLPYIRKLWERVRKNEQQQVRRLNSNVHRHHMSQKVLDRCREIRSIYNMEKAMMWKQRAL